MDEKIDQIKQSDIGKKNLENKKEGEIAGPNTDKISAKQVKGLEEAKLKAIKKTHTDERINQIRQTDIGKKIFANTEEGEIVGRK